MKPLSATLSLTILFVCASTSAEPAPESTFFREFAELADSQVLWAEETGQLESRDAKALVSAIVIEGMRQGEIQKICGVRVDLTDDSRAESVYIEEQYVRPIWHTVRRLQAEIVQLEELGDRTTGCRGRGEYCCNPQPPYDLFSVEYCYDGPQPGFAIRFVDGAPHRFDFPGYRPIEFALSLERALTALESTEIAKEATSSAK